MTHIHSTIQVNQIQNMKVKAEKRKIVTQKQLLPASTEILLRRQAGKVGDGQAGRGMAVRQCPLAIVSGDILNPWAESLIIKNKTW